MFCVMEPSFLCLREHIINSKTAGLWLRMHYLGKRENDSTILAKARKRINYNGVSENMILLFEQGENMNLLFEHEIFLKDLFSFDDIAEE